jgi:L-amino acid N-acyltransferase YncA
MSEVPVLTRSASGGDVPAITRIYNQGIEDRIATLETATKSEDELRESLAQRAVRYEVIVAYSGDRVLGWASLNPYSHRCAYDGVADLSVYVEREARGTGIGRLLMDELERRARNHGFHKLVLFTLPFNVAGQHLYRSRGFREVGTFKEQGTLDGRFVDVMAMEKIIEA